MDGASLPAPLKKTSHPCGWTPPTIKPSDVVTYFNLKWQHAYFLMSHSKHICFFLDSFLCFTDWILLLFCSILLQLFPIKIRNAGCREKLETQTLCINCFQKCIL